VEGQANSSRLRRKNQRKMLDLVKEIELIRTTTKTNKNLAMLKWMVISTICRAPTSS
jgi:hypothetical protein